MNNMTDLLMISFLLFIGIRTAATADTKLTACSHGSLTIPVEPVNRDLIGELNWEYRYSHDSVWTTVVYCNKAMASCRVKKSGLSDGTQVSRGANQSLIVEHSRQSTSRDKIQFKFDVRRDDCQLSLQSFEVSFVVCVRTRIDGKLNLTRVLFDIYPPEQLVEIDLYDANGTMRFAHMNTERGAITDMPNIEDMPAFWSRLQVMDGSLILTGIQKTDNGTKMKSIAELSMRARRSNTPLGVQEKMIQILVYTVSTPGLNVRTSPSTRAVRSLPFHRTTVAPMHDGTPAAQGSLWTVILTSIAIFLSLSVIM